MKKIIGLIAACFLVTACERHVNIVTFEFHQAAAAACEKNSGYQKYRAWSGELIGPDLNYHLVIMCNDGAEFYIKKVSTTVNKEKMWGEWETDTERFGKW